MRRLLASLPRVYMCDTCLEVISDLVACASFQLFALAWPRTVEQRLLAYMKARNVHLAHYPAYAAWDVLRAVFQELQLPCGVLDVEGAKVSFGVRATMLIYGLHWHAKLGFLCSRWCCSNDSLLVRGGCVWIPEWDVQGLLSTPGAPFLCH